jgi:hypothetical protein
MAIIRQGVCGPHRVRLNRIDHQPIRRQQLTKQTLRRAHIQHGRATDPANEPSDLLVAT